MKYLILIIILVVFMFSCESGNNSKIIEVQIDADIATADSDVIEVGIDDLMPDADMIDVTDTITEEPDGITNDADEDITEISDDDASSWKVIKAGDRHNCGIKTNNKLYCWGNNQYGQIGDGTTGENCSGFPFYANCADKAAPAKVGNDTWKEISAARFYTCGIKKFDQTLYCWGDNRYGNIGDGTITNYDVLSGMMIEKNDKPNPTKISNDEWIRIATGAGHACAIKADGTLYCWGDNNSGQFGDGTIVSKYYPVKANNDKWLEITAGESHTCAIKEDDHKIYCWGDNNYGQVGDGTICGGYPDPCSILIPTKIGDETWLKVIASGDYTCGIKSDQKLYCWGRNDEGQLGNGESCRSHPEICSKSTPIKIGDDNWNELSLNTYYACGIKADGQLLCWGFGYSMIPTKEKDDKWLDIIVGVDNKCGIKTDNNLYCWGDNYRGQLGDGISANKTIPAKIGDDAWSEISAGEYHTCGIKTDNTLYCWGNNYRGQLGDGTGIDKDEPSKTNDDEWLKIAAKFGQTCAIKADKTLYCTIDKSKLLTKTDDDSWLQIAVAYSHSCGIKADSKLYCWGSNYYGQLGNGTNTTKTTPTKIGDDEWSAITAGHEYTCGIKKADKKLYCWGHNDAGQLGDGTRGINCPDSTNNCADKSIPTKVGDDTWSELTAGWAHTCGITTEGKLYCWGGNYYGQVGDGTICGGYPDPCIILIPSKIGDDTWARIAAGDTHTCGIQTDNKLYCWGENDRNQLGDGTTDDKTVPTKIGDDAWSEISAGEYHSCGIKADNKLYCWGDNEYGRLGDGSAWKTEPTLVAGQ